MQVVIFSKRFRRGLVAGTLATDTSQYALSEHVVKDSSSLDFKVPQRGKIDTPAPIIHT